MAQGDHFSEAERLSRDAHAPGLAQVHATLAVAEQLARVAAGVPMCVHGSGNDHLRSRGGQGPEALTEMGVGVWKRRTRL